MVAIEYSTDEEDNNGAYGDQYHQPGPGTQAAASALLGFGAASGEQQLTPEQKQIINQSKKEIQLRLAGDNTGLSEDEEDEMIDLMSGWKKGEQLARQGQVESPMRKTTTATKRRVTMSHQKQKTVVNNPYLKTFTSTRTTPSSLATIRTRRTTPSSLSILVNGKENSAATVVSKKTVTRRRLQLPTQGLSLIHI